MNNLKTLEELYSLYNDKKWLNPDPLAVVLEYTEKEDIELAGLLCAALALGNASLIMKACKRVLAIFGKHPGKEILDVQFSDLSKELSSFKYRFFTGNDISSFLCGISALKKKEKSIEDFFLRNDRGPDYVYASSCLVKAIKEYSPIVWLGNLFPDPLKGSASKRTFLFLRWMIRKDNVDPGIWTKCDKSKLIVPLDTHMADACRRYGFLKTKSVSLKAAISATSEIKKINNEDPLKYDFCMTRPGIRPDLDKDSCFEA